MGNTFFASHYLLIHMYNLVLTYFFSGPSHSMETRIDFLEWLEPDMAFKILSCLDDSADLVRASAVSRYWQNIGVYHTLLHT